MDFKIDVVLTEEEYELFLMTLGMGLGVAYSGDGRRELAYSMVRLVNKLCAGNPRFTPYAVPSDRTAQGGGRRRADNEIDEAADGGAVGPGASTGGGE